MQTAFSFVMIFLVVLFYLSNPKQKINQWCALSGMFFWVGIAKQSVMFEIIPMLHSTFSLSGLDERFAPIHSVCTWIIYTLAVPTMVVAGLYFAYLDKIPPNYIKKVRMRRMLITTFILYLPGFILSFIFTPMAFREFQMYSPQFWITYTVYNFFFTAILIFLSARGIHIEKRIKPYNQKSNRKHVALLLFPALIYWLIAIFIVHLLDILQIFQIADLIELWQFGVVFASVSVVIFIKSALKTGFMGIKLVSREYDWTAGLSNINMLAEHNIHFLNTQTTAMKMSIYFLEEINVSAGNNPETAEELRKLSCAIIRLDEYFAQVKQKSENIHLENECWWKIADLLTDAKTAVCSIYPELFVTIRVSNDAYLYCDKVHMTEVFVNIIKNAAEAVSENGEIAIIGKDNKLLFIDNGEGIDADIDIFAPYVTTKSTDKNMGIGCSYCKSVIMQHGGKIYVSESIPGEGTTIEIKFPSKRVR